MLGLGSILSLFLYVCFVFAPYHFLKCEVKMVKLSHSLEFRGLRACLFVFDALFHFLFFLPPLLVEVDFYDAREISFLCFKLASCPRIIANVLLLLFKGNVLSV